MLFIYFIEHIRVKAYLGRGPGNSFSRRPGMHRPMRFLAGAIQSAARSGRFSVEAVTRAAAPFSASGAVPLLW